MSSCGKFAHENQAVIGGAKGNMNTDTLLRFADEKWRLYEREYILPAFSFAEAIGFDLQKAVFDNPGKNCVALLVEHLAFRAGLLGFQYSPNAPQYIKEVGEHPTTGQGMPAGEASK